MKLAIIGSRTFDNYQFLSEKIMELYPNYRDLTIVSGGAIGADLMGKRFAMDNNLQYVEFLPDWNKHGKSAGFKRNVQIINEADEVVAFWDGISKGTKHGISLAKGFNKKTTIILENDVKTDILKF